MEQGFCGGLTPQPADVMGADTVTTGSAGVARRPGWGTHMPIKPWSWAAGVNNQPAFLHCCSRSSSGFMSPSAGPKHADSVLHTSSELPYSCPIEGKCQDSPSRGTAVCAILKIKLPALTHCKQGAIYNWKWQVRWLGQRLFFGLRTDNFHLG